MQATSNHSLTYAVHLTRQLAGIERWERARLLQTIRMVRADNQSNLGRVDDIEVWCSTPLFYPA